MTVRKPKLLDRIDLTWHAGAPTLRAFTPDGTEWLYPLRPSEAAALVKRLAGHLQELVTDRTVDRTADTVAANPDVYNRDQEPAA